MCYISYINIYCSSHCNVILYCIYNAFGQQHKDRQRLRGTEQFKTANLCKDFSYVSQQANTWEFCDITSVQ